MQRRYRKPKPQKDFIKKFRANEQIRSPKVFLIDENNNQVGDTPTLVAFERARQLDMDLVEVSPKANPPVARIMDYGQYKYEVEKKIKKAKAHQKTAELKSVRLSFRIKGNDLEIKKNQALKFLSDGHKVRINIVLRGREKAHSNLARENMTKFIESLGPDTKIIQPLLNQGGQINITISK